MSCAIFHEKHKFDKCLILLDTIYLRNNVIAYCLLWNYTQKQMNLAIKKIWAVVVDSSDNDDDIVSDHFDATLNDTDFQEGESK